MSAYQGECRTDIQTCATTDTVKDLSEIRLSKNLATTRIIQDHSIEILLFFGVIFFICHYITCTCVHGNV